MRQWNPFSSTPGAGTIGICCFNSESRMGELRHGFFACRHTQLTDLSSSAGEVAQDEGQDAAVPVIAKFLLRIYAAQHVELARRSVGVGYGCLQVLSRFQVSHAGDGDFFVPG